MNIQQSKHCSPKSFQQEQEQEQKQPAYSKPHHQIIFKPKKNTIRKSKCAKITKWDEISILEIYTFIKAQQFGRNLKHEASQLCCICQDELYPNIHEYKHVIETQIKQRVKESKKMDVVRFSKCSQHFFHFDCAENMANQHKHDYVQCPVCMHIYGIKKGTQPDGNMSVTTSNVSCSGYNHCGSIVIQYHFPNGSNQNGSYSGTSRTAYLPDNKEGRQILELLRVAFDRRSIFTVGTSVTTGRKNVVCWSGIHHKTRTSGGKIYYFFYSVQGSSNFGYPDPTYFSRVKQQLAVKGITKQNMHL